MLFAGQHLKRATFFSLPNGYSENYPSNLVFDTVDMRDRPLHPLAFVQLSAKSPSPSVSALPLLFVITCSGPSISSRHLKVSSAHRP